MNMVAPPKLPQTEYRPISLRMAVPSVMLFSALVVVAALYLPPALSGTAQSGAAPLEPVLNPANAGELCLRLSENPQDYMTDEALRHRWALRSEACTLAFVNQVMPGFTRDQMLGRHVTELVAPDQREDMARMLADSIATGRVKNFEAPGASTEGTPTV